MSNYFTCEHCCEEIKDFEYYYELYEEGGGPYLYHVDCFDEREWLSAHKHQRTPPEV